MNCKIRMICLLGCLLGFASCSGKRYDIVIYGGTSSGIIAAVQAAKEGKSVVVIEPSDRIGGMTTGGLGETDHGKRTTIGGLAGEYYRRVGAEYGKPEAWRFEPKVALKVYRDMVREYDIPLFLDEYIDLKDGVTKKDGRITSIRMESGREFRGKVFIDATYEGDLMALAGVSYVVGRESNAEFGEKGNGIRMHGPELNELPDGIDPYIVPGDSTSGLLPRVNRTAGGKNGDGDSKVQAYCFRMCLTNDPDNRIMVEKPEGYDSLEYELLLRALENGMDVKRCFKLSPMPNRKTDSNNHYGVSTDWNGANWDYPEADHKRRAEIRKAHETYQKGFLWTVQNHPRSPQAAKEYYRGYGLPKDEFTENGHWPQQLYVRESRRMRGETVITEHEVLQERSTENSIGLGSYAMDSHNTQYFVNNRGFVNTEGGYFTKIAHPYPISYGAITPQKAECSNLLVTICVSATHAAYGSVRMEPVFMILGQSAATAAAIAIDEGVAVQEVDYGTLRKKLLADGQILSDEDKSYYKVNEE